MDIQELLARLDQHKGSFPKDLVEEAIARREEVTLRFLEILEDLDRNPEPWLADDGRMIHIYALYEYHAKSQRAFNQQQSAQPEKLPHRRR